MIGLSEPCVRLSCNKSMFRHRELPARDTDWVCIHRYARVGTWTYLPASKSATCDPWYVAILAHARTHVRGCEHKGLDRVSDRRYSMERKVLFDRESHWAGKWSRKALADRKENSLWKLSRLLRKYMMMNYLK